MKVLITGGTGSFGQAMTQRLLSERLASRIVIFSRGEHLQEDMARKFDDDRLRFFIGDVRDCNRLTMAMHDIDTVIHAAALKVVPIAEYNPYECIRTNIGGAENVARSSLAAGVQRVIALSTDKAVSPLNLYGATKLAAEKIFVAANNISAGRCSYSVCRYGNVVNSRGSVVPLFKRLAGAGEPLPITDTQMTRFWMTLDQAVDLVLSSLEMMKGREIFIPKIPSVRIVDLAAAISPQSKTKIIGIRPGEKLHETLMTEEEARGALECWDRYIINSDGISNIREPRTYSSDDNGDYLSVDEIGKYL
jgi:UDP-N-acetylglucosamine 4,6-dehydratase/5-epimerase